MRSHDAVRPEHLPEEPAAQAGSAIPQAPGTNDSWTLRAPFQRSTKHQAAGISWVAGGGMSTSEATEKSINR